METSWTGRGGGTRLKTRIGVGREEGRPMVSRSLVDTVERNHSPSLLHRATTSWMIGGRMGGVPGGGGKDGGGRGRGGRGGRGGG